MLNAKDLMTKRPMILYSSDTLKAAVEAFNKYKVSSAPVVTPDHEILGILTETALLELFLANSERGADQVQLDKFRSHLFSAQCVYDQDQVTEVIKKIRKSSSGRVLVLDSQKHIVGVVSPKDIFQLLRGEARSAEPMYEELTRVKSRLDQTTTQMDRTSKRLNRLEEIINGSAYMMHSLDRDGNVILANRRIHDVLGYDYGELVGKTLEDLYGKEHCLVAKSQLARLAEGKEQDVIYSSFKRKDGSSVRVEIISSVVKDRDGNFTATSSMSRIMDSDNFIKTINKEG